jgi:catecholate siderophore receptor
MSRSGLTYTIFLIIFSAVNSFAAGSPNDPVPAVIRGRVVDQTGSVVVGASVTATHPTTKVQLSFTSDQNGEFTFTLEPGDYLLAVKADGFNSLSKQLHVSTSDKEVIELSLEIASATANVTVTDGGDYQTATVYSTKLPTAARDLPQSLSIVGGQQIKDQLFSSIGEIARYQPGVTSGQGEGNRDQLVIRGQDTTADFYVNGVRDDVQYFRDLYNLERVETLRGPNALAFGRGGGGGVVNRVTKEAQFDPIYEFTLQGGSYGNRRGTFDVNRPIGEKVALRLDGMGEVSDSFRNFVGLRRYAINPMATITPDSKTRITLAYELFRDRRTADRGITSIDRRPADVPVSTFYGDPSQSKVWANVDMLSTGVERQLGGLVLRNRTLYGDYDKFYQNYVPGSVNGTGLVSISAYNNHTPRKNLFNQTDLFYNLSTGIIKHSIVGGFEFGRQRSSNFRNTGFFNDTSTSVLAPYTDPLISTPITWRQSASDGDNRSNLSLAAAYIQDQVEITRYIKIIGGLRFDHFDLRFHNNRSNTDFRRIDQLVSPRLGVVVKPVEQLSLYASYSVSYLPAAGDQFSTLAANTETLKPEKFQNYELGVKWDIRPNLSFTSAVYRLDRTNTRANDPNRSGFFIQTGAQRANGFEATLSGIIWSNWTVSGSYAYQDAFISRTTSSALAGTHLGQVPRHSVSVWNKYQVVRQLGIGLGVIRRSDMFAALNNPDASPTPLLATVLPAYTRLDGAVFYSFNENWRLQANVENLLDSRYYQNAHNNTNISPGSPRAAKVALVVKF